MLRTINQYREITRTTAKTTRGIVNAVRSWIRQGHRLPTPSPAPVILREDRVKARVALLLAGKSPVGLRRMSADIQDAVAKLRREKADAKLAAQYAAAVGPLYRKSRSGWVGGEDSVVVKAGTPNCSGETTKVWHAKHSWSGTNSVRRFSVAPYVLRGDKAHWVIGGLATLDYRKVRPGVIKATWAEQSRGVDIKAVSGWIIRGYHIEAGTLEQAERTIRRRRLAALAVRAAEHLKGQRLSHGWIVWNDSIAVGNCPAGTEAAARRVAEYLGITVAELRAGVAVHASLIREVVEPSCFRDRVLSLAK